MSMNRWLEPVAVIRADAKEKGVRARAVPPCGTAGCIAGWAVLLTEKPKLEELGKDDNGIFDGGQATRLLDLDYEDASRLFHAHYWPKKFSLGQAKPRTKKYAEIVAARIDHFIATQGAE